LDLSFCQHISGLAALRPLCHLSSLVLVDCTRALHPPCMALLAELPALRRLEISGKRVDDGCMQVGGWVGASRLAGWEAGWVMFAAVGNQRQARG